MVESSEDAQNQDSKWTIHLNDVGTQCLESLIECILLIIMEGMKT